MHLLERKVRPNRIKTSLVLMSRRYISRKQSSPILAALVVWRQASLGQFLVQSDEEPLSSSDEREERPHSQPTKTYTPPATQQGRWSRWFGRSRSGRETPAAGAGGISTPDGPNDRPGLHPTSSAPTTVVCVFGRILVPR